jgi:tetratricopeptide (TPR) repeat protein
VRVGHDGPVIADPSAIPETDDDVTEYLGAMEQAFSAGDLAAATVLARALGEAHVAPETIRARAFMVLGQCLEHDGQLDPAVDAYGRAGNHGDPDGTAAADRIRTGEQAGLVEAARTPQNEAEAVKYLEAANAARHAGDWERAYELYLALHDANVSDATQKAQAAYGLGLALKAMGSHDAAYQYFREASEGGDSAVTTAALSELQSYNQQDGTTDAGLDHPSSAALTTPEAVAEMLQAAIDRYDTNDAAGAEARFTAVHGSSAASAEQKGYAAYYLGVLAWHGNNYDVARVHFREAKASADSDTAGMAGQMLQQHWGE